MDPPYFGAEHYYEVGFTRADHERLASVLKNIKGKFALSYYDDANINALYPDYNRCLKEVAKHSKGMVRNSKTAHRPRGMEQLIMNY